MLKALPENMCREILDMFQYAHEHTVSPKIWHQAIIAPLYKKGDILDPKIFRPIVLRCTIAKIYEIILLKKIRHVIEWGKDAPPMNTMITLWMTSMDSRH